MQIKVNGKIVQTNSNTIFELEKEFYPDKKGLVRILNGFQTAENLKISEGDTLVFIEKGKLPNKEEFEAMISARHTPQVYEKVKRGRVAIAGLGGLGSNIAVALARTGVGHLHLVDFDVVEPSNLNRQQYKIRHLGMYKTEALRAELEEINPFITIQIDTIRVSEENVLQLFAEDEIICEAFDNPEAKALLINAVGQHFPEKKMVAGSGMAGYESSNLIQTKKSIGNLYICGDGVTGAQVGRGLMAPRVAICAGHEANMILRLLLGIETV